MGFIGRKLATALGSDNYESIHDFAEGILEKGYDKATVSVSENYDPKSERGECYLSWTVRVKAGSFGRMHTYSESGGKSKVDIEKSRKHSSQYVTAEGRKIDDRKAKRKAERWRKILEGYGINAD